MRSFALITLSDAGRADSRQLLANIRMAPAVSEVMTVTGPIDIIAILSVEGRHDDVETLEALDEACSLIKAFEGVDALQQCREIPPQLVQGRGADHSKYALVARAELEEILTQLGFLMKDEELTTRLLAAWQSVNQLLGNPGIAKPSKWAG